MVVLLAALAAASPVGAREGGARTTGPDPYVVVATTLTDSGLHLSPPQSHGVHYVAFLVTNKGHKAHNFVIGRLHTHVLKPGQSQHLVSFFPDYGTYRFACTLNCSAAMGGRFRVGR